MSKQLFMEERRRTILNELQRRGRVSVKDLSDLLDVSTVTIRQDLRALEDDHLLERTHGGAVLPKTRSDMPELSFDLRMRQNPAAKHAIAREAAKLVRDGDSIALDASTTAYAMLTYLKDLDRLTIVTNSIAIARECLDSPQIDLYMMGGRLRRDSIALVGSPESLPDVNLVKGFFGARGIAYETGITETNREEVVMKQAMMSRCLETVFMLDGEKWHKVAPYTLADVNEMTHILTSTSVTAQTLPGKVLEEIRKFEARGVTVTTVHVGD